MFLNKNSIEPGPVVHACNLSTQEAQEGGLGGQVQPGLHRETLKQKNELKKLYRSVKQICK
jgi:hypothetical protein